MDLHNEFDDAIIQHVRSILGPDWIEDVDLTGYPACPADADPREWKAFIDGIPPFPPMTAAELIALAEAYGE